MRPGGGPPWPRGAAAAGEREVVFVGSGLAGIASLVLLGSLAAPWYRHSPFCISIECPPVATSGFATLAALSILPVVTALGGLALALAGTLHTGTRPRLRYHRPLCAITTVIGLGTTLLVLARVASPPTIGGALALTRTAGIVVSAAAAGAVAGAAALAGIGPDFFARSARVPLLLGTVLLACAVAVASLFLPWVREPLRLGVAVPQVTGTQTAWHALPAMSTLLLLGALALAGACGLVALIRWRSAVFALAGGGWLVAVIAVIGTALGTPNRLLLQAPGASGRSGLPGLPAPALPGPAIGATREYGYFLCLAAAAVVCLGGVAVALGEREPEAGRVRAEAPGPPV